MILSLHALYRDASTAIDMLGFTLPVACVACQVVPVSPRRLCQSAAMLLLSECGAYDALDAFAKRCLLVSKLTA